MVPMAKLQYMTNKWKHKKFNNFDINLGFVFIGITNCQLFIDLFRTI